MIKRSVTSSVLQPLIFQKAKMEVHSVGIVKFNQNERDYYLLNDLRVPYPLSKLSIRFHPKLLFYSLISNKVI